MVASIEPAAPARLAMNDGPIEPRQRMALCSEGFNARRASRLRRSTA